MNKKIRRKIAHDYNTFKVWLVYHILLYKRFFTQLLFKRFNISHDI